MTENKRFTLDEYWNIDDSYEQKIYHGGEDCRELCELLNVLDDENEQLKQEIKELQGKASSWKITASEEMMKQSELMKENGQLKSTLAYRSNQLTLMEALIDDLGSEEMKRQMEDILE